MHCELLGLPGAMAQAPPVKVGDCNTNLDDGNKIMIIESNILKHV